MDVTKSSPRLDDTEFKIIFRFEYMILIGWVKSQSVRLSVETNIVTVLHSVLFLSERILKEYTVCETIQSNRSKQFSFFFFHQGTMAASQISAQAYIECSAKTNSPGVREVFEMAALASIGKLNLQKSYVDLSSAVRRKSLSTSLQTRMRRSQSVNGSLRVRASMVEEDDDKKCAIM